MDFEDADILDENDDVEYRVGQENEIVRYLLSELKRGHSNEYAPHA
jgi:hypothetical protein